MKRRSSNSVTAVGIDTTPTRFDECYQVSISSSVTTKSLDGSHVTWYCLEIVRKADMLQNTVHRRYREFSDLDALVRKCYDGLPPLPDKGDFMSLLLNFGSSYQTQSKEFINSRRNGLHYYMICLGQVPSIDEFQPYLKASRDKF